MLRIGPKLLVPLAVFVPFVLRAQEPQRERIENPLAITIEEGLKHVANQKWVDAIELFQRAIDTSGDELVPIDHYQWHRVRWVIHREIARMPEAGREVYRRRVDGPARQRLEEAKRDRDFESMRRIPRDWFNSRPTEEALNLLAEEAFLHGDFASAERYWRMIHRPASVRERADSSELIYPDPSSDPAAIRARLILIQLFREELREAEAELIAFRKVHPDASGYLAGKRGPFAETLEAILKNPAARRLSPARRGESDWPTFAGDPSRDSQTFGAKPYQLPETPTWRIDIPTVPLPGGRRHEPDDLPSRSSDHVRSLAFHPIQWNDYLLFCDAARIWAIDAKNGQFADVFQIDDKPANVFDLTKLVKVPIFDAQLPSRLDSRYTLTLSGGAVYARCGAQRFAMPTSEARDIDSFIVCLAPVKDSPQPRLASRWVLQPRQDRPDAPLIFEGTPVVQGDQLFVGATRMQGGEFVCYVACYEGLQGRSVPRLSWIREVGKHSIQSGLPRSRAELLTLAESSLFYCSPSGTVMSIDPKTGRPNWEFRYPKRNRDRVRDAIYGRDLCPCVVGEGRVFVAPPDAERVFALDAFTGRLLWQSRNLEVIHLLGVSRGNVICTLDRPIRGICGLDVESGTDRYPDGWLQHDGDGEATFGRGFISDGVVYWPTKGGLHFLNAEDGAPLRQPLVPRDGYLAIEPFGNLIPTENGMFVATPTQIWGYVAEKTVTAPAPAPKRKREEPRKAMRTHVKLFHSPTTPTNREPLPLTLPLQLLEAHASLPLDWQAEARFDSGSDTILCFPDRIERRSGSEVVWTCLPDEFPSSLNETGLFSAFRLVGDLLLTVVDESRLAGIDTATGVCRWVQWASSPRGLLGPNRIVFRPRFYADESYLVAQVSSGVVRLIDLRTGKTLHELPGSTHSWQAPPILVAKGQVVYARDPEHLVRLDLASGKPVWTYKLPGIGSLAGQLPEVRLLGGDLLVGVVRNHGYEIDKLDAGFAKSVWTSPTIIPGETLSLHDIALGEQSFHLLTEDALCAYSNQTGERLWRKPLDLSLGSDWWVRRMKDSLILCPRRSVGEDLKSLWGREAQRLMWGQLAIPRWVELVKKSYDGWRGRRAALILVDAETGSLLQRLNLDAPRGPTEVRIECRDGSLKIRAGEKGYRFVSEK